MTLDYQLIFGIDKQMHLLSFAIISLFFGIITILLSEHQDVKQRISIIWITLVTIGVIEEYRQSVIPNRSAEVLDAIANILGVTIGLAIPLLLLYMFRHRHHYLCKVFTAYSFVLIPLLLGLVYINERPFLTLEQPFQERLKDLVAMIGW
ncbi:MAG TPA: hypothetical protein DCR24_03395 [Bacillus bacterium]|nr:hypothetical protein [Bacillus sp. (in: firmicutes)]